MPGFGREGRLTDTVEKRCSARFVNPVEGLYQDPVPLAERRDQRRQHTIGLPDRGRSEFRHYPTRCAT